LKVSSSTSGIGRLAGKGVAREACNEGGPDVTTSKGGTPPGVPFARFLSEDALSCVLKMGLTTPEAQEGD
jgi:hypothetical protein